jgi:flavin reductase (DIM6/NTAB) family NADH-FMN oxidoreductase RutF
MFDKQWALAAAGSAEDCNAMTIGWGALGTIWGPATKGRSIVTIFLRENRYTLEYIRKNDTFSVSFFPEEYRKALIIHKYEQNLLDKKFSTQPSEE